MFTNDNQIAVTSQKLAQAQGLTLALVHSTIERTEVFEASSGHSIIVKTTHSVAYSQIDIAVFSDDAYVIALHSIFHDFDYLNTCKNYLAGYMHSPALADICEHFDELCTPYDDNEE